MGDTMKIPSVRNAQTAAIAVAEQCEAMRLLLAQLADVARDAAADATVPGADNWGAAGSLRHINELLADALECMGVDVTR